jgi:hypothetical protein
VVGIVAPFMNTADGLSEAGVPVVVGHLLAVGPQPGEILDAADAASLEPAPAPEHRVLTPEGDDALTPLREVGVDVVPAEPRDLVVLAIGVVVAALRSAELVAAEEHGDALRQQQRRDEVAPLSRPQLPRWPGRSVGPSVPWFHDRLCDSPSLLSSPLASLCFSLYETRSRSVKPSWAVTKLIDAVGRRVSAW